MLFEDPARKYPHLAQALNALARRRFDAPLPAKLIGGIMAVGTAVTFASLALNQPTITTMCGFLTLAGMLRYTRSPRPKPPASPAEAKAQEATRVAQGMSVMLAKRRLHRDLDPGSLTLMEECARYWSRAKAALEGPFWTAGDVPPSYASIRLQALSALDEAMDDVLIEYRGYVPHEVQDRSAMDYVDEALESVVFRRPGRADFPPAAFSMVREIAEKLRALANEAERMANEARMDPLLVEKAAPGRSLDETLSELRQIREAEEELRQNLHG